MIDEYLTTCVPGICAMRNDLMIRSSGFSESPFTQARFRLMWRITPSARVMAVPLGASRFSVWCISSISTSYSGEVVEHLCEVLVYLEEDIHAYAEVRGIEKRAFVFLAKVLYLGLAGEPPGSAAHNWYAFAQACVHIVERRLGMRELNGYVALGQGKVGGVISVDTRGNRMAALDSYPFDDPTHFSVSKKNDIHDVVRVKAQRLP